MRDRLNCAQGEWGRHRSLAAALAALAAAVALALATSAFDPRDEARASELEERPNVVVIMTDDQAEASTSVMENVRSLLGARGATFAESFVSYPLCCPSRATFLTGQYMHNHGVRTNAAPRGGFYKLRSGNTLPVWLQRAGYYTAHIGKYLNDYGRRNPTQIPSGYSEWHTSVDPSTYLYFSYALNENGQLIGYGDDPDDYNTDVYTEKAVELIERQAAYDQPFFLWLSYLAPHFGGPFQWGDRCDHSAIPAPRHFGALDAEPLPDPPSFNEPDVSDKPRPVRRLQPMFDDRISELTDHYRCDLEALLAVDEGVKRVVEALERTGELDRTLVIFTSDNGQLYGEHRLFERKYWPYEEAIRVPLIMRGPGVPEGVTVRELVSNVDLAKTIAQVANAKPRLTLDGISLLPTLHEATVERGRGLLIEANTYSGIRTRRYLYIRHRSGETELYDLEADPYQVQSQHGNPAYAPVKRRLARRVRGLQDCSGEACHTMPRLSLRLRFEEFQFGEGSCAGPPILARVSGRHRLEVEEVSFYVDGELVAIDASRPFKSELPYSEFHTPESPTPVRATADFIDGRRKTLDRGIRACG